MSSFRVVRQDLQVPALTWFLHKPPVGLHAWTDDPNEAAPLSATSGAMLSPDKHICIEGGLI